MKDQILEWGIGALGPLKAPIEIRLESLFSGQLLRAGVECFLHCEKGCM